MSAITYTVTKIGAEYSLTARLASATVSKEIYQDVILSADSAYFAEAVLISAGKGLSDIGLTLDEIHISHGYGRFYDDVGRVQDRYIFSIGKVNGDTAPAIDILRYDLGKILSGSANPADSISLEPNKAVADEFGIIDSKYSDFGKILSDTGLLSETLSLQISVSGDRFEDIAYSTDDLEVAFGKSLSDTSAISEYLAKTQSKNRSDESFVAVTVSLSPIKGIREPDSHASDNVYVTAGKSLSEAPALSESHFFGVDKKLADTLIATDDFDGINGDDQTGSFGKGRADQSGASDVFSRVVDYSRSFIDDGLSVDFMQRELVKSLADAVNADDSYLDIIRTIPQYESAGFSDDAVISLSKYYQESPSVVDNAVSDIGKVFADDSGVSDVNTLNPLKALLDNGYVVDSRTIDSGKNLQDQAPISESLVFDIDRIFADDSAVIDSWLPLFIKYREDQGYISDNQTNSFGKNPADASIVASAGSLISQGYVDNNGYFSDDYVGQQRSFQ